MHNDQQAAGPGEQAYQVTETAFTRRENQKHMTTETCHAPCCEPAENPGIPDELRAHTVTIDGLTPYPNNPRRGDTDTIARSLQRNRQYRPIVINTGTHTGQPDTVLAGNHTLTAARNLGWAHIAATRIDVDHNAAARIVAVDNRTNDLAGYDDEALLALLADLPDLDGTGYDEDFLRDLEATVEPYAGGLTDPDDVPDPPAAEDAVTRPGDVWILGDHRLVCGDSNDKATLDLVTQGEKVGCLLTDPPYGMNLDADYSKMPAGSAKGKMNRTPTRHKQVAGDDRPFDASFLRSYFGQVKEQFWFGADYYRRTLSGDDIDGSWLIWDKRTEEQDDVIGSGFETCWSAQPHQRRLLRHYWCGAFGAPEARERVHPTQKPTGLLVDILTRWAPEALPVVDAFGGSGSTLIAAEMTGRPARVVELDPAYCDVIARRWQEHTGRTPVLRRDGHPDTGYDMTTGQPADPVGA